MSTKNARIVGNFVKSLKLIGVTKQKDATPTAIANAVRKKLSCTWSLFNVMKIYKMPICLYVTFYPKLQRVAKKHGYALLVHGSCRRDFDLLAVPWAAKVSKPVDLAEAIKKAVDGFPLSPTDPVKKPHRRLAWSIIIGSDMFIDLSVIQF